MAPSGPAHPLVGTILRDKWRVDSLLGQGGMATVYAGTHLRNGLRVAIKVLRPTAEPETQRRFSREGYIANQVDHPGVVRVLDDDTTPSGDAFLVMELVEGESLEARLVRAGGRLPIAEVVDAIEQVLDVLATAHDKGIVHRDLKPDNVLVLKNGAIKLLDFGIAGLRTVSATGKMTVSGKLMGTPAFMSPEQTLARWDEVDAQSDIFSLGATMWNLLTGRILHPAESVTELLVLSATKQAPPLASVMPEVPASLAAVVDRALAFRKADRWPDARTMRAALARAAENLPEPAARILPPAGDRDVPTTSPTMLSAHAVDEPPHPTPVIAASTPRHDADGSDAPIRTTPTNAKVTASPVSSDADARRPRRGRAAYLAALCAALVLAAGLFAGLRSRTRVEPPQSEVGGEQPAPPAPSPAVPMTTTSVEPVVEPPPATSEAPPATPAPAASSRAPSTTTTSRKAHAAAPAKSAAPAAPPAPTAKPSADLLDSYKP